MKQLLIFLTITAILASCSEQNQPIETAYQTEDELPIVGKWKLHTLQKKEKQNSEVNLKSQPTEVVLSLMDGGYFIIYDTFTDPRFNQKGFSRISERSKGQWEYKGNKLILHHNFDDSTRIEELEVTKLNKNTLITKGRNKQSNIYKTYEGY